MIVDWNIVSANYFVSRCSFSQIHTIERTKWIHCKAHHALLLDLAFKRVTLVELCLLALLPSNRYLVEQVAKHLVHLVRQHVDVLVVLRNLLDCLPVVHGLSLALLRYKLLNALKLFIQLALQVLTLSLNAVPKHVDTALPLRVLTHV